MPETLADRLAALEELRADVEAKLADAEALAVGTGQGARLSRQDAASYRRQLGLLTDLEAWLLAGRRQAAARMPVAGAQDAQERRGDPGGYPRAVPLSPSARLWRP